MDQRGMAQWGGPVFDIGARGGGDQQREGHHADGGEAHVERDVLDDRKEHDSGGQHRPQWDPPPAAGAHFHRKGDADRELDQPQRWEQVDEPERRDAVTAGKKGGHDDGHRHESKDQLRPMPNGGDRPVDDREAQVEEDLTRQRPSHQIEGEEVLELRHPRLDQDQRQTSDPAAVRSALSSQHGHHQQPRGDVARVDPGEAISPEPARRRPGLVGPRQHEAGQDEEERHGGGARLQALVDHPEMEVVEESGRVEPHDERGGKPAQGRERVELGLRTGRHAPITAFFGGSRGV